MDSQHPPIYVSSIVVDMAVGSGREVLKGGHNLLRQKLDRTVPLLGVPAPVVGLDQ